MQMRPKQLKGPVRRQRHRYLSQESTSLFRAKPLRIKSKSTISILESFSQIFTSLPFSFIIEDIHRELISQYSKPLASMINSDMLEAKQDFATLEDLDLGTMTRFIEWLYRDYYSAATPKLMPKHEQSSKNSDSQKTQEGSDTSFGFDFGVAEHTFSDVDATETLRSVFSTPTSQASQSLFARTFTTAPADSSRVVSSATNGTVRDLLQLLLQLSHVRVH